MCGIVGAIAKRNVMKILLAGLQRLEYRGYDSAGIAVLNREQQLQSMRACGKVAELAQLLKEQPLPGMIGIAHTRWATHGEPAERNAHPLLSRATIAVVHNGIIENHGTLKQLLIERGYAFTSETDTEVIAHLLHYYSEQEARWVDAIRRTVNELEGAFALGIINQNYPDAIVAVRSGSPLVIGVGIEENFIASDELALLPVTQQFMHLEEGDIAVLAAEAVTIIDNKGQTVSREIQENHSNAETIDKGRYRHFMQKEIFEQAEVLANAMANRSSCEKLAEQLLGIEGAKQLTTAKAVQIVACGTSYHAGLVAKYWLEAVAGIPTQVEVASEFRYRQPVVLPHTLFVTISQSGETADTLAALRQAKQKDYVATLAICNVAQSTLARESDVVVLTRAGTEIGVASTKAFTTQLVVLLLLTLAMSQRNEETKAIMAALRQLPGAVEVALSLDAPIKKLARRFIDKQHALFLGRGVEYPIALEGALKLKEISYVHAEAYPAGELKHGPLALVDREMPVITIAPKDHLLAKLMSNLEEVRARGGELFVFADQSTEMSEEPGIHILRLPTVHSQIAPILYTIPLQLLAYHVAVLKGTDVDQPRNLAKSVTVE